MRWFVDISPIGAAGAKASRFCVEAEQWQRALQSVRALRGDTSPFANFSIELLEDGYRAIDPATRSRYVVQKAPDDSELTTTQPVEVPVIPSVPPPAPPPSRPRGSNRGERRARTSDRGRRGRISIPDDPVPPQRPASIPPVAQTVAATRASSPPAAAQAIARPVSAPAPAPPVAAQPAAKPEGPRPASVRPDLANGAGAEPPTVRAPSVPPPGSASASAPQVPIARPMQAETAFERMTAGLASFPVAQAQEPQQPPSGAATARAVDVTTEILPRFRILSERSELPSASSPLTYREMALAVSEATSFKDAEAIVRAQFEVVRASLRASPQGQFITLAVFDHEFQTKPKRLPLATLSFKDWRDAEPVVKFPLRDARGSTNGPTSRVMSEVSSNESTQLNPIAVLPIEANRSDDALPKVNVPPAAVARPASTPAAAPAPPAVAQVVAAQAALAAASSASVAPVSAAAPSAASATPPSEATPSATPLSATPPSGVAPTSAEPTPRRRSSEPASPAHVQVAPATPAVPKISSRPPPSKRKPPTPTPSEIRRAAVEMSSDELTDVKPNHDVLPIPDPPESLTQVMPAPATMPSEAPGPGSDAESSPSETPTPALQPGQSYAAKSATDRGVFPAVTLQTGIPTTGTGEAPFAMTAPIDTLPSAGTARPGSGSYHATPGAAAPHPSAPPPAPPQPSAPPPAHASAPPPVQQSVAPQAQASAPPPAPVRTSTAPVAASQPPPSSRQRVRGDDLIAELFEALSDLEFLVDPLEGADFVLGVALESLPSEIGLVSFFSLDNREFVVVRASAGAPPGLILKRANERVSLASRVMRAHQAVVLTEGAADAVADDPRWQASGIAPKNLICAPVKLGGRYLGLIELANPIDGVPYTNGDGNAVSYIAQQFAEFLGQRDVVLDPDRISAPRLSARVRR